MLQLNRSVKFLTFGLLVSMTVGCGTSTTNPSSTRSSLREPQILPDISPIPSLDARVTKLVFFSSSPADVAPVKNAIYKNRFESASTAKVHPQINLVHAPPVEKVFFTMTVQIRESGKTVRIVDYYSRIDPNATSSYHSVGVGVLGTGNWRVGNYDVDVHIDGLKVATGYFQVY